MNASAAVSECGTINTETIPITNKVVAWFAIFLLVVEQVLDEYNFLLAAADLVG